MHPPARHTLRPQAASPLPGTTYVESLAVSGEDLLVVAEWADRAATLQKRLDQAVTDGKLTQAEADAAIEVARTTAGVRKVVNLLEIITIARAKEIDSARDNNKPVEDTKN